MSNYDFIQPIGLHTTIRYEPTWSCLFEEKKGSATHRFVKICY